ncbi:MAG: hypothetical protein MUC54_08340, partial [Chloroflexi bacterium]|nr:hypothetical protein [Chloroflexota bacterium]
MLGVVGARLAVSDRVGAAMTCGGIGLASGAPTSAYDSDSATARSMSMRFASLATWRASRSACELRMGFTCEYSTRMTDCSPAR